MSKVSVIMPAYNAEKYIGEAIESILNQTFTDFEFIIIDDCSKDATAEIINRYTDERIRYVKNEQNMGVARTLNRGLDLANGTYIARMDSDDISLPERFQKQVDILDRDEKIAVCGSNSIVFSETKEYPSNLPITDKKIKYNLFISSPFIHPAVMIRKSVIVDNNLKYDLKYEGREDYHFWMQVSLRKCALLNINEPLLRYRIHDGQVTQRDDKNKLTNHLEMKAWYLDSIGIDYSEQELAALCRVSIGQSLETIEEINSLMSIIIRICHFYDDDAIPDFFLGILYHEAKSVGCLKKMTQNVFQYQPIKVRLKWCLYMIRGIK